MVWEWLGRYLRQVYQNVNSIVYVDANLSYSHTHTLNYDRVHSALDDAITEFNLDRPTLFQKSTIDRTALTFYNGREVCAMLQYAVRVEMFLIQARDFTSQLLRTLVRLYRALAFATSDYV